MTLTVYGYKIERNANLYRADLYRADLTRADLRNANLYRANLYRADLRNADLTRADLTRADLRNADLTRADLRGADLTRADLTRADLTRADLRGADLRNADLTRADLALTCLAGYPGCTPAALEWQGWEVHDGWVYGVRTAQSQYCGNSIYMPGSVHVAPYLSACHETECHPGIYMCRDVEHARSLGYAGVELVRVRARCDDVVTCSKGLRTRQLEAIKGC